MAPVDNQVVLAGAVPPGPPGQGTIQLSTLIDYIIQRTYHDLSVLSELLPRRTDMERKIDIVQFASRTRLLFVRLLALVKWANSASKVDKCGMISSFLDQQAMLFVDTADRLARMARETLVQARLPCFSLPYAVDVLTTGTYPRLPTCIKDHIVPPDPISSIDKRQTLMRLNQIIEHRLVTSNLPPLMRKLKIENGRVKFNVDHEFQVALTLMGDGPTIPWRLLDIEILVEDPDTGDGKALVHSLQVNYIHQLVQSRIKDSERPLHDLYNCLHSFCQSLQLEVLHSQAQRLIHHRLGECVRIDEYNAGRSLTISYWRDTPKKEGKLFPASSFKLSIHVDEVEPCRPLQVTHIPQIQGSESTKVAQAIRSEHLSVEKLLIHTIQVRSTSQLLELERDFRILVPGPCEVRDLPCVLYVPVLYPCMDSEKLCVAVNILTGAYLVSLGQKQTKITEGIEESLNGDRRDLRRWLSKLRIWLGLRRCETSIQQLQAQAAEHLPIVNISGHPLESLSRHRLYIRLPKQSSMFLVVEVRDEDRNVVFNHYLLQVKPAMYDGTSLPAPSPSTSANVTSSGEALEDTPQVYMEAGHLMQLDTYACTHGPSAKLHDFAVTEQNPLHRKRKLLIMEMNDQGAKRQKRSAYYVPELTHMVALCEDRIPFILLADELAKRSIPHQGIQVDGGNGGLSLMLIGSLPCFDLNGKTLEQMQNDLLSCKFRIQRKPTRIWMVESTFTNCPIRSTNPREQGDTHRVFFASDLSGSETIDKTVQNILDDWKSLAVLYEAVINFANVYNNDTNLKNGVEIRTFTYKRLTLAYGQNRCYTVTIQYKNSQFQMAFGTLGQTTTANCHTLVASQLTRQLNHNHSIAELAQTLLDTWAPLTAVGRLNTSIMLGLNTKPSQMVPTFSILPQSPTHIRVVFRSVYCIDIHCRGDSIVGIRDGAYSMFDTSKVVEGLIPTQGLKSFLNLFVDDTVLASQTRRRSATEDDNPPSPIGMDTADSFLTGQGGIGSPAARRYHNPMTPPSNPHTPASPSTRMTGVAPSPAMIGTPSPGGMLGQGSPSNPSLHVPSPSSFVPAPSPSSLGIHMPSPATNQFISPHGMIEGGGSPYPSSTNLTMPSPGPRQWPGSPSVPGPSPVSSTRHATAQSPGGHPALHSPHGVISPPSRILPQRSWAASVPTLLSHDALFKLLTPGLLPGMSGLVGATAMCCPLERFLGCVFLRRHMVRVVQSEDSLHNMQSNEPGVILFKVESLQFRISLNPTTLQSLHLKVTVSPDHTGQWEVEELQVLEKFFELKVVSAPYKANALTAFGRVLGAPLRILKDFVQIMKIELVTPANTMKWSVQWCLTFPQGAQPIAPLGTPAVVIKGKILFILQLTRINVQIPPGTDSQTIVIPILYDIANNVTQMAEQRSPGAPPPTQASVAVNNMLKRFTEYASKPSECSILPAVRELMTNLVVPM